MEIPSIESMTALHAAVLQQRIDTAVLAKADDIAKARGDGIRELLDAAALTAAQSTVEPDSPNRLDAIA